MHFFCLKSSEEQKKTLHHKSFVHLAPAPPPPPKYAPEHLKNWAFAPIKDLVMPLGTTQYKTFVSLYCQHVRVNKSRPNIHTECYKKEYGIVANF